MRDHRFSLLRRSLLTFSLALAALLLSDEQASAAGDCGGFCVSFCPSLSEMSDMCHDRWGGTCGIGATCAFNGDSSYLCGWEPFIRCYGNGAVN